MTAPEPMGSESPSLANAALAPFRDAWLSGRVRLTMLRTVGSGAAGVTIAVYRGNVILAGDVASRDLRERVAFVVADTGGVIGVSNRVVVRGSAPLPRGGTDAEIRLAVVAGLRRAFAVRASIVTVESVYDGVVRLAGVAPDAHAQTTAFDIASEIPGVRRVINDVALPPPCTAAEDDADAA